MCNKGLDHQKKYKSIDLIDLNKLKEVQIEKSSSLKMQECVKCEKEPPQLFSLQQTKILLCINQKGKLS